MWNDATTTTAIYSVQLLDILRLCYSSKQVGLNWLLLCFMKVYTITNWLTFSPNAGHLCFSSSPPKDGLGDTKISVDPVCAPVRIKSSGKSLLFCSGASPKNIAMEMTQKP
jgi:hypothetical protein